MKQLLLWACIGFIVVAILGHYGKHDAASPTATVPSFTDKEIVMGALKLDLPYWCCQGNPIMIANFVVHNPTAHAFKDIKITCTHFGPGGTVIDHNTRTVYQFFSPNSTKKLDQVNMGFIHEQAEKSACRIVDLTVVN